MRSLTWIALLVPLLLAPGCAKRSAKNAAPSKDESAAAKPQPQPAGNKDKKGETDEKTGPNLLNDPRFQKEQPGKKVTVETLPNGKPIPDLAVPMGLFDAPNPGAPGAVPPGAPGVSLPPPQPAPTGAAPSTFKPVGAADMKEVWIFIENASGASGKMPSHVLIYQALVTEKSPAAELVRGGSITLTGAAQRESVWAFETRALIDRGWVASQNGVEELTAAELRKRLGK